MAPALRGPRWPASGRWVTAPPRVYWFTEGFTEFHSRRLDVRAGLLEPEAHAREINEVMFAYFRNPYRTASNRVVQRKFWFDRNAERLPYQRGELLALNWHAALREAGQPGLDAVMAALLAEEAVITTAVVDAAVREQADIGVAADVVRFVEKGEVVALRADALGPCFTLGEVEVPTWDAGFDVDASARARTIVGVVPGGPAEAAGLRDGQGLLYASVYTSDLEREVQVGVSDGEDELDLSYLPHGPGATVPGFVPVAGAAGCTDWF